MLLLTQSYLGKNNFVELQKDLTEQYLGSKLVGN